MQGCAPARAFFSATMFMERRQSLASMVVWTAAFCLAFGGFFVSGCDSPTAPDSSSSSSTASAQEVAAAGVVLRADPNPVPAGNPNGTTTISWATGSDGVGDVYVVAGGNEKLFGSGSEGSQDAPWIRPGSTEFRLYSQADHKLLARLTVTMASSDSSGTKPLATPASTANPSPR